MNITDKQKKLLDHVQVNIPFRMLVESYLNLFTVNRINPEIGIDADALENFDRSKFTEIADTLSVYRPRITLHGPFIDLSAGSKDPRIRSVTRLRLEQLLELVPIFKPVTVVCHAGYDAKRYAFFKEEWIQNSLDVWSWFAEQLNKQGAHLMLENVYEHDPSEMLVLLNELKSKHVGLCLDTGHLWSFGKSTTTVWLDALGEYIGQFHLHDNDGTFDQHLGMGSGNIDFEPVWQYIKSRKSDPPVITLEPHQKEDLLKSLAYLEYYAELLIGNRSPTPLTRGEA
ncbi:MAG: sugar phosphate isomerase/epimerase [Deltaproteobacteria bacterium]|nr:sugar phosphate isomerase/epimerase [Deltaproteobacteria bacterium]